mgnify:CR=1 FL=1
MLIVMDNNKLNLFRKAMLLNMIAMVLNVIVCILIILLIMFAGE